jgi:hypothetical protein
VCVALGAVGGITMGLDDDTTGRAGAAAALVYGGWFAGRAGMRSIRGAN